MGVPALFRWLSRKYPKIVQQVVEDTPTKVRDDSGEIVEVPVRYEGKNPNGFEVDNLYLDMNGIVHPCTHPEGKPAPETEEDMMVEVFNYTERVVNMARPRKVLMMAIDGVAPRAKMNQQRSRRFRAAQEAADKAIEHQEAIKLFEAMGHSVSKDAMKKAWDSNAITPGTPFMDLLSNSLKYWVSYKMSTDPGWKDLKVIISDSSVPGEGEHKIVDWIRRQRSYPDWDANTSHVMYGLDADLIMLSLATHEPNFRVLREDVFFQGSREPQVCKKCGQPGHIAANCKGEKIVKDPTVVEKPKPVDPKPFIFLDVSVLREYLAVELDLPGLPFPFNLELAIDDWIFLIFFVGNDFLPHLPSLEIREGAIDTLLRIWRAELPRMGGYLTNHGKVAMDRAQIILEGLAKSEDEIFQKRKEDEQRQEGREKRRRIDEHRRQDEAKAAKERSAGGTTSTPGTMTMNGTDYVEVTPQATARGGTLHPSLPTRPGFDTVPQGDVGSATAAAVPLKGGKKMTAAQREAASLNQGGNMLLEAQASNKDIVENRRKIRMANLSAAQALKAELTGGPDENKVKDVIEEEKKDEKKEVVGNGDNDEEENGKEEENVEENGNGEDEPRGTKRKAEEDAVEDDGDGDDEEDDTEAPPNPEADQPVSKKKLKINPDGTVDGYVDEVRLWEPGYRERYYQSKFGVPVTDTEFIAKVTKCYMEGLCWVLEYYYQGVPAWDWYYPYHYAPFAQDFKDVGKMDIRFEASKPFTPFAQLLGVFPAASRIHLPDPLHSLMTDDDSPIIDFYPSDFDIDMNGKKMAWQGVALLPFIDQHRLLAALASKVDELTDDEKRRNSWGDNVMFIAEANALYDSFCQLYTIKPPTVPVPIDSRLSLGTNGSVLADPACVPNAGYDSPLVNTPECPDIENNQSISVRYYFPKQAHSHRSVLLPGYRPTPSVLSESDCERTRRGDNGGRGGRGGGRHLSGGHTGGPGMGGDRGFSRGGGGGGGGYGNGNHQGGYGGQALPSNYYAPPPPQPAYGGYGYGGGGAYAAAPPAGGYGGYGGQGQTAYGRAPPPSRGGYGGGGYGGYGGGGVAGAGAGYGAPPPRNPYGAPPQNPYGRQPNPYGAPGGNSYGGYGGGRGGGQGGSGRGGYNPYGGRR